MNRIKFTFMEFNFAYTMPSFPDKHGFYSSVLRWEDGRDENGKFISKRVQKKKSIKALEAAVTGNSVAALYRKVVELQELKDRNRKSVQHDDISKDANTFTPLLRILTFQGFLDREYDYLSGPAAYNWKWTTKKHYLGYINRVTGFLPDKPFALLDGTDYDMAIQMHFEEYAQNNRKIKRDKNPGKKRIEYSENTKESFYTIFNNLLDYAAAKGYILENQLRKKRPPKSEKNPHTAVDVIRRRRQAKRSLSPAESALLWKEIKDNYLSAYENPIIMLVAIMDATGARTGEACAIQYSDIVEIGNGAYAMRITNQINSKDNNLTTLLKTQNAYRQIPLHSDLYYMIKQHKELQQKHYNINDTSKMYLVSHGRSMLHWNPSKVNDPFKKLMKKVFGEKRADDLNDAFMEDGMQDVDPLLDETSYLMRKNFCTNAYAACAMTQQEVKYLMGHKLNTGNRDKDNLFARSFTENSGQLELWRKINRRPLFSAETQQTFRDTAKSTAANTVTGTSIKLEIAPNNETRGAIITIISNEGVRAEDIQIEKSDSCADYFCQEGLAPLSLNDPPNFSVKYREVYKELIAK